MAQLLGALWGLLTAVAAASFDVYGFQPVVLPMLPSGARLVLKQDQPAVTDTLALLRSYVHQSGRGEPEAIGSKLWPAAALLCRWLLGAADGIQGSCVLELGAGTGACGLFAGALGAARVTLTDGGGQEILGLLRHNAAANAPLLREVPIVEHMSFGDRRAAADLGAGMSWVLAADVLYGQASSSTGVAAEEEAGADARRRAESLADTMDSLLDGPAQSRPRVLLAHEHRARMLRGALAWDSDDVVLAHFVTAAQERGLRVLEVVSERPHVVRRDPPLEVWSADLSLLEVERAEAAAA
jgi:predicted RNA methylase